MKNYSKKFKLGMLALIVISVVLLVWGFIKGFTTDNAIAVDVLFYWTYVMMAIAVAAVVLVGIWISYKNNPKSLIKLCIGLVAVAAICFIVYLISPGKPAVGFTGATPPTQGTLRLTDTVLNLTYITGAAAIIAIIVGEIVISVRNKK